MRNTRKSLGNVWLLRTAPWLALSIMLLIGAAIDVFAQTPTPTPDNRGLGVQSAGPTNSSQAGQQAREAKPELVLLTGYNNFMGATRLVFSPDKILPTLRNAASSARAFSTAQSLKRTRLSSPNHERERLFVLRLRRLMCGRSLTSLTFREPRHVLWAMPIFEGVAY